MLGQFGDLVDEADLGCQHAVGGVLGQFGAAQVHEHDPLVIAVERRIQLAHDVAHRFIFTADNDTVRAPAVFDRRAFLEKLRIGDDIELQQPARLTQCLVDMAAQGVATADRHGGFLDDDQRFASVPGDGFAHREKAAQVGRTIGTGGRADRDEQDLGMFHCHLLVGGETQTPLVQIFTHQIGQSWLVDMHLALTQLIDLGLVNVHADHIMADFGEHGRLYQANISATENADFHGKDPEVMGRKCAGG